jgi:limonene-1,2-epoxide hydrolase
VFHEEVPVGRRGARDRAGSRSVRRASAVDLLGTDEGRSGGADVRLVERWWNAAFKDPEGFTPEAFGRYFTEDAVMRINGTNRAQGLTDLAARFRMIQKAVDAVEIKVPFVEAFSSPDGSKIFTYHLEEAVEKGKPSHSMVMGYVEVRDGKIALVNFMSVEGQPGPVAGK